MKYTPHPNDVEIRKALDAVPTDGGELWNSTCNPKIVMHVGGRGPLSGNLKGLDAVNAWVGRLVRECSGTWKDGEILELIASADSAFRRSKYRAKRGKRVIEGRFLQVMRLRRGKIVEIWLSSWDQYGFDKFWS